MSSPATVDVIARAAPSSRAVVRETTWIAALTVLLLGALVLPPLGFLIRGSIAVGEEPQAARFGVDHFAAVLQSREFLMSSANSLLFAAGSAVLALLIGWVTAWIVERTNTPLKPLAYLTAIVSLGTPYILYVGAWLMLLGKAGPLNQLYRALSGTSDVLVDIYSMPGMIMVEGFLWSPLAFLLVGASLRNANPELEEAARVSGAGPARRRRRRRALGADAAPGSGAALRLWPAVAARRDIRHHHRQGLPAAA